MTKNKNILIGGLIAVVLVMTIAYAAFASQLNITGTGNITSEWNIHFDKTKTDDIEGVIVPTKAPGATTEPTGTLTYTGDLSVTLTPTLKNPGDTVEFNLTVVNDGNIDAVLQIINMPASTNPAIKFTRSGMEEGTKLPANSSKTFTIIVEYDSAITSQPESTTADLTATLTFVQDDGSSVDPTPQPQTVYAYHTDTKTIGTSILTASDYFTDYTQISGYDASTRPHFLKYDIDSEGVIQNAYACMKYSFIDQPVCLQGGSADYFASNKIILEGLKTTFNANSGSCHISDMASGCNVGDFNVYVDSNGNVHAGDYSSYARCNVDGNGAAYCSE